MDKFVLKHKKNSFYYIAGLQLVRYVLLRVFAQGLSDESESNICSVLLQIYSKAVWQSGSSATTQRTLALAHSDVVVAANRYGFALLYICSKTLHIFDSLSSLSSRSKNASQEDISLFLFNAVTGWSAEANQP